MARLTLLLLAIAATPAIAATAPGTATAAGPRRVVWVAAHPDDELLAAPLLASLCLPARSRCTLLVLTRGEAGHCLLPNGCHPTLASVRSREMERSARQLNAQLILWNLPDGGGLSGQWAAVSGGDSRLATSIASVLTALAPDLVLTFDPRHGSTCHGDHRKVGELIVAAVAQMNRQPHLELLETLATTSDSPFAVHFTAAADPPTAGVVRFSANGSHGASWSFVPRTAAIHRSQFPPEAVMVLRKVPAAERAVFTAPAAAALASDSVFSCQ